MVRSIISYAVIGLLGLASSASAVFYADYELDPSYGLAFAGPLSTVTSIVGNTLIQNKAACNLYDDCIAILQNDNGASYLLGYNENGVTMSPAGFTSVSWRFDAQEGPSCSPDTDYFEDLHGGCVCQEIVEVQNTAFGCSKVLIPSGIVQRRSKKLARSHIMPGRPAGPAF